MFWNHIDIQYEDGIHPSQIFKSYFQEKLCEVLEESPDGSVLRAQFRQHQGFLEGILEVHSFAGNFLAQASGSTLNEVGQKLLIEIRKQIHRWKLTRYEREEVFYDSALA